MIEEWPTPETTAGGERQGFRDSGIQGSLKPLAFFSPARSTAWFSWGTRTQETIKFNDLLLVDVRIMATTISLPKHGLVLAKTATQPGWTRIPNQNTLHDRLPSRRSHPTTFCSQRPDEYTGSEKETVICTGEISAAVMADFAALCRVHPVAGFHPSARTSLAQRTRIPRWLCPSLLGLFVWEELWRERKIKAHGPACFTALGLISGLR